ncbi:MAG TPA: dUTP diphosphatase [Virgibacillus sp.]|nr:dUTP diphosphatase [Virgibacillus sp.]
MEWNRLYDMQQELDGYIENNHILQKGETFPKKLLALFVELGEMANETRCFKFWSTKPPSEKNVILEEYVDVLHFILSLGLETDNRYQKDQKVDQTTEHDITTLFLDLFQRCTTFGNSPHQSSYNEMVEAYLALGKALGYQETDVAEMYVAKNKTNYKRQDEGY